MFPVGLLYYLVSDLMNGGVPGGKIPFYVAGCVVCIGLILLTTFFQYNATYFATYKESGIRRITLAEHLRKIPLSFFGKKDLADLTSTIMADCTFLEQSFSHFIPELVANQSARCVCAYVYSGASVFESTTDLVFSGATLVCENGTVLSEGERFKRENVLTVADVDVERLLSQRRSNMSFENSNDKTECVKLNLENKNNDLENRFVDSMPFVPSDNEKRAQRCKEIFAIQASGLAKRIEHVGSNGVVVGISGGLDSTLALLVSVSAMKLLGKNNSDILGVTMPGFGTTDRTYQNAIDLMKSLGVTIKKISIKDACVLHMKDIEHDSLVKDITYENTQARERTQILFDLANKHGKLLVGTGDLSELAMGWCTYNGDHMSMYGVNASVPKTLVKYLVEYVANISDKKTADILYDVLDTPGTLKLTDKKSFCKHSQPF